MSHEVLINKVKTGAEEFFRSGGFYCSEAIVASVRKNLAREMPEPMIAAASGFPVGVGRSKCMVRRGVRRGNMPGVFLRKDGAVVAG